LRTPVHGTVELRAASASSIEHSPGSDFISQYIARSLRKPGGRGRTADCSATMVTVGQDQKKGEVLAALRPAEGSPPVPPGLMS